MVVVAIDSGGSVVDIYHSVSCGGLVEGSGRGGVAAGVDR